MDGIINSMEMSLSKPQELVKAGSLTYHSPWGHKELTLFSIEQNPKVT